ncbi:MAG: hypothetical protein E7279_09365 [Lachnospiraceae bacterium]|nr:hypothetical protein [Lachnospiraceae bacterium]
MVKVISKRGAMKTFYYLMAIDGIDEAEEEQFDAIGNEIMKEEFEGVKDSIKSECSMYLEKKSNEDDRYDFIQEGIDEALSDTVKTIEEGVVPRLLLWDMLTIAMCDKDFSTLEERVIGHVARVLKIDKSVFMEMKQLIITVNAVEKEKEQLELSECPYSEIRPIVDEIEKRRETIVSAAVALIEDDIIIEQNPGEVVEEDNAIVKATRVVTEKTSEGINSASRFLGEKAEQGVSLVSEGAGKLFGIMKKNKLQKKEENKENDGL